MTILPMDKPTPDPQPKGILARIANGINRFGDELLVPTSGIGKLGAYLGAASGGDLGRASLAAMNDQRQNQGTELQRQLMQLQLEKLRNPTPPNNDTVNDYNFFAQRFGPDYADNWLRNQGEKPQAVQSVDPNTGEVKTFFVRPSMLTDMAGGANGNPPPPPTAPVGKLTPLGGQTSPSGAFR